jgi:hypothetical protein
VGKVWRRLALDGYRVGRGGVAGYCSEDPLVVDRMLMLLMLLLLMLILRPILMMMLMLMLMLILMLFVVMISQARCGARQNRRSRRV